MDDERILKGIRNAFGKLLFSDFAEQRISSFLKCIIRVQKNLPL